MKLATPLVFKKIAAALSPAAGESSLYVKADGKLYIKDGDTTVETLIGSGSSGGVVVVADTTARNALTPTDGNLVYINDIDQLQLRRNGAWENIYTSSQLPHFRAKQNSNSGVPVNNLVSGLSVVENEGGGVWDGRYSVPRAGVYRVMFTFKTDSTVYNPMPVHQIRGGAAGTTVLLYQPSVPAMSFGGGSFFWEGRCALNDKLNWFLAQNSYTSQVDGTADNNALSIDFIKD